MRVGIIGKGSVGRALHTALGGKHSVRFGTRTPAQDTDGTIGEVAGWADVVVLATPWSAEADVAAAIERQVSGKPVLDATNPVGMTDRGGGLATDRVRAAAETLQARLPDAHVVKAFNQIGAQIMADPSLLDRRPVMFAASDDAAAKAAALELINDAGFGAVDGGPLSNASHLESLAMLWIWMARHGPLGRTFGFTVARPGT